MNRLSAFALFVLLAASALAQQTVTIGFTVSKTGSLNVDSVEQFRGFELWQTQVNAAGGIKAGGKTYKINLVSYDDESNSKRVQQLYSRLILQDKADFLFSPYSSGLTATAAVVTEQFGKIMLTTGAAEEKTYKLGNRYLYQMFAPAADYLKAAIDALKTKDAKANVAFVYEDSAFSVAVVNPAKTYAQQQGIKIGFAEAYAPNTTDFSAILDKVIGSKATVIMGGGHYADGATLARQIQSRKAPVKLVVLLVAPDSPRWVELGAAGYGVMVPSQWEPQSNFDSRFGPSGAEFAKAYAAKYNAEPSYESAGGYAAGLVLQRAIEQAGGIDTAKVAQALNETDMTTFWGRTKFSIAQNEHGLQTGHSMVLAQWQNDKAGKPVKQVVWPPNARRANMIYPIH